MQQFEIVTAVPAPPEQVFALCLDVDAHTRSLTGSGEQVVGGRARGELALGESVTFRARHLGLTWRLTARITAYDRPEHFVDEQEKGPFAHWRHAHHFAPDGAGGTVMRDTVEFAAPLGPLGRLAERLFLRRYMIHLLTSRNAYLAGSFG